MKDIVIHRLVYFLYNNIDSDKDIETSSAELDIPNKTALRSLFEEDQSLNYYDNNNRVLISRLENNKVLAVASSKDEEKVYFWFGLFSESDKFFIKTDIKNKSVKLYKDNIVMLSYKGINNYYIENLPPVFKINNLRETTLEQLFERGKKEENKVNTK